MLNPSPYIALLLACFAFFSPAFTDAQTATSSDRQIRALVQKAHSHAEFLLLAAYFKERSRLYETLAAEQQRDLTRELDRPSVGSKYPTAADRARRLHEYYAAIAESSHEREQDYAQRASDASKR